MQVKAAKEQELIELLLGGVQELSLAHASQLLPVLGLCLHALLAVAAPDSKQLVVQGLEPGVDSGAYCGQG